AQSHRLLGALRIKYPKATEPAFYDGVSELFLDQNEAAVQSLEIARRAASAALRDDTSWYLAVAYSRSGKTADARREVESLCGGAGEYKASAAAASGELNRN